LRSLLPAELAREVASLPEALRSTFPDLATDFLGTVFGNAHSRFPRYRVYLTSPSIAHPGITAWLSDKHPPFFSLYYSSAASPDSAFKPGRAGAKHFRYDPQTGKVDRSKLAAVLAEGAVRAAAVEDEARQIEAHCLGSLNRHDVSSPVAHAFAESDTLENLHQCTSCCKVMYASAISQHLLLCKEMMASTAPSGDTVMRLSDPANLIFSIAEEPVKVVAKRKQPTGGFVVEGHQKTRLLKDLGEVPCTELEHQCCLSTP
jgi:hypothetical protein